MQTFNINPTALYDEATLRNFFDFPATVLSRARRDGHLQFRRIGRRTVYLGTWLLAWLESRPQTALMPDGGKCA